MFQGFRSPLQQLLLEIETLVILVKQFLLCEQRINYSSHEKKKTTLHIYLHHCNMILSISVKLTNALF